MAGVNEADTIWQPPSPQEGEYNSGSSLDIVDPTNSSIFLIDPSGVFIVDTGNTFSQTPYTVWDTTTIEVPPASIWNNAFDEVSLATYIRITQNNNTRITQDGNIRITQPATASFPSTTVWTNSPGN